MSKRITCIAIFDEESLKKLDDSIGTVNNNFCKVPFREKNREKLDALPYHFTFTVWDEIDEDKAIGVFNKIQFNGIKLKIKGVNIKESFDNSWNLYFEIEKNQSLFNLQKKIYNLAKNERYNPDIFIPHITIHCDKDYDKLVKIKNSIMGDFFEFEITVTDIGLYRIYPVERLK